MKVEVTGIDGDVVVKVVGEEVYLLLDATVIDKELEVRLTMMDVAELIGVLKAAADLVADNITARREA